MPPILFLLTTLFLSPGRNTLPQDVKVAIWSAGSPDTDNYESFAFWVKDGKRAYIRYVHGNSDDIQLRWLGPASVGELKGFKAAFPAPDNRTLFFAPVSDSTLLVTPTHGHGKKYYFENETANPASDCDICAGNAGEAAGWLRQYFWN